MSTAAIIARRWMPTAIRFPEAAAEAGVADAAEKVRIPKALLLLLKAEAVVVGEAEAVMAAVAMPVPFEKSMPRNRRMERLRKRAVTRLD